MKKFIAFYANTSSGIVTKGKAIEWATNALTKNTGLGSVHISEVIETVERVAPTIEIKPFFTQLNEPIDKVEAA